MKLLVPFFVTMALSSGAFAQSTPEQLELPGLCENLLSASQFGLIIATEMAMFDETLFAAARETSPDKNGEPTAELAGQYVLAQGGVLVTSGDALKTALRKTFFYKSEYKVLAWARLYTNVDMRFEILASNIGSDQKYWNLVIYTYDFGDRKNSVEVQERAIVLAEAIANALKSQEEMQSLDGLTAVVKSDAAYTVGTTTRGLLKSRVDVNFRTSSLSFEDAVRITSAMLSFLPQGGGQVNSIMPPHAQPPDDFFREFSRLFEQAKLDAKAAAARAGKSAR